MKLTVHIQLMNGSAAPGNKNSRDIIIITENTRLGLALHFSAELNLNFWIIYNLSSVDKVYCDTSTCEGSSSRNRISMLTGLFFLSRFYCSHKTPFPVLTFNLSQPGSDWTDINLLSLSLSLSAIWLGLISDFYRTGRCCKFMGLKFWSSVVKISISDGKKLRMFEPSANNRDWITVNYNSG